MLVSSTLITKRSVPYKGNCPFRGTTSFPVCNRLCLLTSSLHWFLLDLLSVHTTWSRRTHYNIFKFHHWNPHQQPSVPANLPHRAYSDTPRAICTLLLIHSTSCLFQYLPSCVLKTSVQINKKMFRSGYLKGGNGEGKAAFSPHHCAVWNILPRASTALIFHWILFL